MGTTGTVSELGRIAMEIAPPLAKIGLLHPPLNVIDIPMMDELARALAEIDERPDVSVIVIRGAGKAFSAGVDIAAHSADRVDQMLAKFHSVIRAIVTTKKVTIAMVHGLCLGGGAELAMMCDFAYTSDDAEWGFPEIKLGCFPPVACTALAALVGQKRAAELILTGCSLAGREAADIGLATRCAAEGQLDSVVHACVGQLLRLSSSALAVAKKATYAWDSMHFDKGLARAEKVYFEELMKTADANEGIRAFLEKRPPKWTGR